MNTLTFDDYDWFADPETGCWMVNGVSHAHPQKARVDGEQLPLYRLFWIISGGQETPDMDLHHDCLNRACINPFHLREMTHADHARWHALRREHSHNKGKRKKDLTLFCCPD